MTFNFTLVESWIDDFITLVLKKIKNLSITIMQNCKRQQQRYVDPVSTLPIEIINEIFMLPSLQTKIRCIYVSKLWREKIINCPDVWSEIEIDQDIKEEHFCSVAFYVKQMIINSASKEICFKYIEQLRKGCFRQIQSLKITGIVNIC